MKINAENSSPTAPPIFILCCERSDSSLLRYILDTHPDIASPAELNLGELCRSLYFFIESTIGEISSWQEESQKKDAIAQEVRKMIYPELSIATIWCNYEVDDRSSASSPLGK